MRSRSTTLAIGCRSGTIRLRDTARRRSVGILSTGAAFANTLAFHPAGEVLVAGNADGGVRLWKLPLSKSLTRAE